MKTLDIALQKIENKEKLTEDEFDVLVKYLFFLNDCEAHEFITRIIDSGQLDLVQKLSCNDNIYYKIDRFMNP